MKGATIRRRFRPQAKKQGVGQPAAPSRVVRQLALAHHIEALIDSGKLTDYAQAARQLGLTRARLTQLANLLLLAPSIQGRIMTGELSPSERALRSVTNEPTWANQTSRV